MCHPNKYNHYKEDFYGLSTFIMWDFLSSSISNGLFKCFDSGIYCLLQGILFCVNLDNIWPSAGKDDLQFICMKDDIY